MNRVINKALQDEHDIDDSPELKQAVYPVSQPWYKIDWLEIIFDWFLNKIYSFKN